MRERRRLRKNGIATLVNYSHAVLAPAAIVGAQSLMSRPSVNLRIFVVVAGLGLADTSCQAGARAPQPYVATMVPRHVQAEGDASSDTSRNKLACADRVAELGAWLKELQDAALPFSGIFPGRLGVRMAEQEGEAVSPAPLIELVDDRIGIDGTLLGGDADSQNRFEERLALLETSLADVARMHALLHPSETPSKKVAVAVDRDVTWERVVALSKRLAKAGITSIDWCFASSRQPRLAQPRASSIRKELQAIVASSDPSQKARMLAVILGRVLSSCAGAQEVFNELATVEPDGKLPLLRKALPPAILGCHCAIDIDALKGVLFGVWGTPPEATTFSVRPMRLGISPSKESKVVSMPAVTPWSTASHSVIDAAGTKVGIFLETAELSANARRDSQTDQSQTYVLMVELRKPVDKNARTFLRMTGKKLYRSLSTGAFHILVSRAELKTI